MWNFASVNEQNELGMSLKNYKKKIKQNYLTVLLNHYWLTIAIKSLVNFFSG
jgi:hypothetical protein